MRILHWIHYHLIFSGFEKWQHWAGCCCRPEFPSDSRIDNRQQQQQQFRMASLVAVKIVHQSLFPLLSSPLLSSPLLPTFRISIPIPSCRLHLLFSLLLLTPKTAASYVRMQVDTRADSDACYFLFWGMLVLKTIMTHFFLSIRNNNATTTTTFLNFERGFVYLCLCVIIWLSCLEIFSLHFFPPIN